MASAQQFKKKMSSGKKIIIGIGVLVVIGIIVNLDSDKNVASSQGAANSNSTETLTVGKSTITENESNWTLAEDVDPMDNTKRVIASLKADNTIEFGFPYGESDFTINIRKWKSATDIYLNCSSCQFIGGIAGEKTYRVKFDDDVPFTVTANHTTSGSADLIFLGNEQKLINKLKTAKKLLIEPEFFDVGFKPVTFSVHGFKWQDD